MKVSVIIHHSGEASYIERSIESISAAFSGEQQIILVGPSVQLGTSEDVKSQRPGNKWLNRALTSCYGDFVNIIEAGEVFLPGALDRAVSDLIAHRGCNLAYGAVVPADAVEFATSPLVAGSEAQSGYFELLEGDILQHQSAILYRRSALFEIADHAISCARLNLALARRSQILRSHGFLVLTKSTSREKSSPRLSRLAALAAERQWTARVPAAERARRTGSADEVRKLVVGALKALVTAPKQPRTHLVPALIEAGSTALAVLWHPSGLGSVLVGDVFPWIWRRATFVRRLVTMTDAPYRSELDAAQRGALVVETIAGTDANVMVNGPKSVSDTGWDYLVVPIASLKPQVGNSSPYPDTFASKPDRAVWHDDLVSIFPRTTKETPTIGRRVLIAGYFSFTNAHATAGDIEAQQLLSAWLRQVGCHVDVATAKPFLGGVDWRAVPPGNYDQLVFVCGPFRRAPEILELLHRFRHAKRTGLNLTLLPGQEWSDLFEVMFERDSRANHRPDMAFGAVTKKVPIVGVCLREHSGATDKANAMIARLLSTCRLASVPIDTRLDSPILGGNATGLRTAPEVESLIARMDVVVTTRLHGLVLALKNGVPALALDPGNEGYKICRQAASVGWPAAFPMHSTDAATLQEALAFCLTDTARAEAVRCGEKGAAGVEQLRTQLLATIGAGSLGNSSG